MNILIIDDDVEVRAMIAEILEDESYTVYQAESWDSAKPIFQDNIINLVFLDLWLQEGEYSGINVLEKIKNKYPTIPVVMISGHGNIEIAVKAIKYGAYDFIEKPFVIERMLITASRAIESASLKYENVSLKRKKHGSEVVLIGNSAYMVKLRSQALKAAASSIFVHISSCKGGGGDDLAWLIHSNSERKEKRFLIYDCKQYDQAALSEELFGTSLKSGVIKSAAGGTLFLNNVFCLNEYNQRKLLDFARTGQLNNIAVDTRIISNSYGENIQNSELSERLSGIEMCIKPLHDRMSDIIDIISYYYNHSFNIFGISTPPKLENDAQEALINYSWPGNVTQLRNILENLFITVDNTSISISDLPDEVSHTHQVENVNNIYTSLPLKEARDAFEFDYLSYQLKRFSNNMANISKFIGMDRSALYKKVKTLGISSDE